MAEPLRSFLRSVNDAGVEYAVVGAHAVAFHGYPRATQDLDILYAQTEENARRLAAAVSNHIAVDGHEAFLGPPDEFVIVRFMGERVDLLPEIAGIDTARALERAVPGMLLGEKTRFLCRDDLIVNKRSTGRARDVVDADAIEGDES